MAGIILAGTFTGLMTQPIRELFQFGFAMGVGLLLDTFLVRGAFVRADRPRTRTEGGAALVGAQRTR